MHKDALFKFLVQRWGELFGAKFEVLLYDLTSTYFETDQERGAYDLRQYGYSRDKRGDCRQVVIARIVTPEGFLAHCLRVTLKARLRRVASGTTPREVIEAFKSMQMVDVQLHTTDGCALTLTRYTQPKPQHCMLPDQLRLQPSAQPPPRITTAQIKARAAPPAM